MDPLTTLTAAAIAKVAFDEFVKAGVGELAKKSVAGTLDLLRHLREKITQKFQGNPRAEAALHELETQGTPAALEKVTKYLDLEMVEDEAFATEVRQTAQQIINIQNQDNSNRTYNPINYRRDQIILKTILRNFMAQNGESPTRSHSQLLLLQEVEREVDSRLAQSLHNYVLINLEKESQPQYVKRIWDAEVRIGSKPAEPLSPEMKILDVFELPEIAGRLLILGQPGAGKTTTMLDLARALVDIAKQDPGKPVPVLLNLSSWQDPQQSMPDWFVEELRSKYGVRKDIGKKWLLEKQLLPLLDGLDEVKPEYQLSCVEAINQWMQSEHRPSSIVVCCRQEEFTSYQKELQLNGGAICLQALTEFQLQQYLTEVKRPELWQMVQHDPELLKLVKTPLFLSITVLAYEKLFLEDWQLLTTTEQCIQMLLHAYVDTMLERELRSRAYRKLMPPEAGQTIKWLKFLAKQLQRESQTEFLIEKMQPSWLSFDKKRTYELTCRLIYGLIYGLNSGLIFGLIYGRAISF